MAVRFRRLLAAESSLDYGEFTTETESGRPALRCPWCGLVFALPRGISLDHAGRSSHSVRCPQASCAFWDWVELESVWSS